jgi:hypothetical protein
VNRDFFIGVLLGGKLYFLPVRHFEGATDFLDREHLIIPNRPHAISRIEITDFLGWD